MGGEAKPEGRGVDGVQLWRERVEAIPSLFARLILCSQLRDTSGNYFDEMLAEFVSAAECSQAIAATHRTTFQAWLKLDLKRKIADLKPYLETCSADVLHLPNREQAVEWTQFCRDLAPSETSAPEIQFFIGTVQTVLRLIALQRSKR